jgi:trans-aconitate methyltransferase
MQPQQTWKPDTYERNGRFVSDYGSAVVDLLNPQPGERVLDLGCGDGVLTEKIAAAGARMVGFDSSASFVDAARARSLEVHHGDAHELPFRREFDAVFSNAAMHWMLQPTKVIAGVARSLKPGGRFVAEMGGHGCVAAIDTALRAVYAKRGRTLPTVWYFPTPDEYGELLKAAGFDIDYIALIPRPTPLPGEMVDWIRTFRSVAEPELALEAQELLRPALCDSKGKWTADYMRLRFAARLPN